MVWKILNPFVGAGMVGFPQCSLESHLLFSGFLNFGTLLKHLILIEDTQAPIGIFGVKVLSIIFWVLSFLKGRGFKKNGKKSGKKMWEKKLQT